MVSDFVLNSTTLSKAQLRFLRKFFGLTQAQISEQLRISGKQYVKCESEKTENVTLSPDKALRLKLYYAELLGIRDAETLYEISRNAEDSPTAKIPARINPTKDEEYRSMVVTAKKKLVA